MDTAIRGIDDERISAKEEGFHSVMKSIGAHTKMFEQQDIHWEI
jgi:hypothetical protein